MISLEYLSTLLTASFRKADFDSAEVTIRVLGPSDPIPSAESFLNGLNPSNNDAVVFKYGSSNGGGVRHSKRLRQGKGRKQTKKMVVWKSTIVRDIKNRVSQDRSCSSLGLLTYSSQDPR